MKAKYLVAAGLALGLTAGLLAACGGGDSSTDSLGSAQKQMTMSVKSSGTTSDETAAEKNFSPATLSFLESKTGLDAEQWNNIMRMVNKSEQDDPSFSGWVKYYGYCQNIGDGRGITMAIQGATTGGPNDGGPDGPGLFELFNKYNGASKPTIAGGLADAGVKATMDGAILKINESDSAFCAKINALNNNANWRAAVWESFYDNYISYAYEQATKRGFKDANIIGAFTDSALNQGASGSTGSLQDMLSKSGSSTNETTFFTAFTKIRETVAGTQDFNSPPINGKNRALMWLNIYNDGGKTLIGVDSLVTKVTGWTMQ